jgi:hypothetical protein
VCDIGAIFEVSGPRQLKRRWGKEKRHFTWQHGMTFWVVFRLQFVLSEAV